MTSGGYEWKLKALTPIWTGDMNRRGDRLILTGLMGSVRWWFEVLVRGLGGKACDPTSSVRCPDHKKHPTEPGHHCVACELFGCTGWARKFRLMVLDTDGNVIQRQIARDTEFTLRFIPLRPIREEEWCLLDCTLRLIADYGAVGGKTVLKPSDEANRRDAPHHRDYGLVQYISGPDLWKSKRGYDDLKDYVARTYWRREFDGSAFSWASLQNFWCVKEHYLARQSASKSTFNRVIGRPEPRQRAQEGDSWLAGRRATGGGSPESKKVFSFKHPQEGGRTFGFVKPGTVDWNDIQTGLQGAWGDNFSLIKGDEILRSICNGAGGTQ